MKIVILNGSPRKECTYTALQEAAAVFADAGIDVDFVNLGTKSVRGCIACEKCRTQKLGCCIFSDDLTNDLIERVAAADAFLVGSPVYYAGMNGALKAVLDRMFYAAGHKFMYKPAAALVSVRRAGATTAIDEILKYFTIYNMPVVTSCYWPMVHGEDAEQIFQDAEGVYTVRLLASNMVWMMKSLEAARAAGIEVPHPTGRPMTNFIDPRGDRRALDN